LNQQLIHSWLCFSGESCTAQEIASVISSSVALFSVLCSTLLGFLLWRVNSRTSAATLVQAVEIEKMRQQFATENAEADCKRKIEIEEIASNHAKDVELYKRNADLVIERRRIQLSRVREMQRSAELTRQRAQALSHLQIALSASGPASKDISKGFIDTAGDFLRAAASIFAPPEHGAPNLPSICEDPLVQLRTAVVRVTLLLNAEPTIPIDPASGQQLMDRALMELDHCVTRFVHAATKVEAAVVQHTDVMEGH
jgi:hypothetical protein